MPKISTQAREYGHACEAADGGPFGRGVELGPLRPAHRGPQWDCESVLSKLTNTDNHPGRIAEPGKRRSAAVVLSGVVVDDVVGYDMVGYDVVGYDVVG